MATKADTEFLCIGHLQFFPVWRQRFPLKAETPSSFCPDGHKQPAISNQISDVFRKVQLIVDRVVSPVEVPFILRVLETRRPKAALRFKRFDVGHIVLINVRHADLLVDEASHVLSAE